MKKIQDRGGSAPMPLDDIQMLLKSGILTNDGLNSMLEGVKKQFVQRKHPHAIFQMQSTNPYKNGSWKTWVNDGEKRKEIIRKTESELIDALYEFYRSKETESVSLDSAVDQLMDHKALDLNRSPNTIRDNRRYFSSLSEEIRTKQLGTITETDLRAWLRQEYLPSRPIESALRKMLQLLKELFRFGKIKGLCVENPAESILFEDYAKDCERKRRTDEQREFSEEEIETIRADALKTPMDPRALMTLMAIETGMRAAELSALYVSDVKDGFLHVHQQQIRVTEPEGQVFRDVGYTKNERRHPHDGRYVPITEACEAVLRLAMQLPGQSDHLFHDAKGNAISKDSYEHNLRRRCARLGIETHHNHAFRVAFNSRMIELGFSPADRAYILGHAVETNERNYSISDNRRRFEMRDRLRETAPKNRI